MIYVTTAAQTITAANGLLVQVNKAFATTDTVTLTAGGTTFAVITGATVGSQYRYNGLRGQGAIVITPSVTTLDLTVSTLNRDV